MAETKINDNQLLSGGSDGKSEKYLPKFTDISSRVFIKLLKTGIHSNDNADYYISIKKPGSGDVTDGTVMVISNILFLHIGNGPFLEMWNYGAEQMETLLNNEAFSSLLNSGQRVDFRFNIDGTTLSVYYKTGNTATWTVGPVITDTGINPSAVTDDYLGNNTYMDNSVTVHICWSNFRIVSGGQTLFDTATAVRGLDYNVYNDNDVTVLQLLELL